jgi:hypothetical protein
MQPAVIDPYEFPGNRLSAIKGSIADIRTHIGNWRAFKRRTGAQPKASMALYVLRFVLILAGVAAVFWYAIRDEWTWSRGLAICLPITLGFLIVWTTVERRVWNQDLRSRGLSSEQEVWRVTEFPPE